MAELADLGRGLRTYESHHVLDRLPLSKRQLIRGRFGQRAVLALAKSVVVARHDCDPTLGLQ
jgi:hypothetical protein